MYEEFYVQYWDMSEWEPLVTVYCTFDELLLNMQFGLIVYAEDAEGNEYDPFDYD